MARPDDSPLDVAPTRLRIGAAAASLGVSVDTLRRWEKEGRIRFERVGNQRVISSEEVERLLRGLPGVDDVAVLGVPHATLGQVLTAVVVGRAADDALRAGAAGMPAPSRPRRWVHADVLPRTSGGKLRRDALPGLVLTSDDRVKPGRP